MKKDAYYFPHFCNARHDRKVKRVMKELGIEGYGIFFMLLETLREQSDFRYPMEDIDLLADEFGTSEQKLRTVVCNYGLFNIEDDQRFFSPKLIAYLKPYLEKSERARAAALLRWNKEGKQIEDAKAMQMQSAGTASKVKDSKVKDSKGEEKNKYGTFANVLLTDDEFAKLQTKFFDYQERIDRLSEGIESKGYKYKSHYATILSWSRNDNGRSKKDDDAERRERFARELLEAGACSPGSQALVNQIQGPQTGGR